MKASQRPKVVKKARVIPYKISKEMVYAGIHGLPQKLVPEIKVTYNRGKEFLGKVDSSKSVADFLRQTYESGKIQLQEAFVVLYLNQRNEIIGYYRHSIGGIAGTVADIRIIMSIALTSLSVSIVLCHNHPSGNIMPSESDKAMTRKFREAGKLLDIQLLDHVILTKTDYFSFADEALL